MRFQILIILFLIVISLSFSANITLKSGNIYFAYVQHSIPTQRWFGLNIEYTNKNFAKEIFYNESKVYNVNLKDGNITIILPKNISFDISKFADITQNDLEKDRLFSESLFPIFYPNYDDYYDNPKNTFCCNLVKIEINGKKITSFEIDIGNEKEYLSNYDGYPAFILFKSKKAILPVNTQYDVYTIEYKKQVQVIHIYPLPCFDFLIIGNSTETPLLFYVYTSKSGIEGVNISIYDKSKLVVYGLTNTNGIFSYLIKSPGLYKVIFSKKNYCTKQTTISIYPPIKYAIHLRDKVTIVNKPICFEIYKNKKLTQDNVYIIYPNQSISKVYVNKTGCITPKSPGKYFIILSRDTQVSNSFVAIQVLPKNFVYSIISTWKFLYMIIQIIIILISGAIAFLILMLKISERFKLKELYFKLRR